MKTLLALIGVGLIASIAFNVYQQTEIGSLKEELETKTATADEESRAEIREAEEKAKKAEDMTAKLREKVAGLEGEISTMTEEAAEKAAKKDKNPMAAIGEMFENEEMRPMIKAQLEGQIDMMFGDLYGKFQLEGEDLDLFKELLVEQQMSLAQLGMRFMNVKDDPAARDELKDQIDDMQSAYKEKIKEFLNSEEDFETYEFFTKTQSERMEMDSFEKSAERAGQPVTEAQKDALVQMMYEEREAFDFDSNFEENSADFDYERLNPEHINRHFEQMAEMQKGILAKADQVLSPEQVPLFEKNQGSFLNMLKMQMNMASQMMGKGSE